MIDRTPDAVLAYAISIGDLTYCVEGESTILVTVSDEVNIVIPASSAGAAKYVDIDIDQIQGLSSGGGPSQPQSGSSQMENLVVLTIWISSALKESFYVNALGQNADSINLAFTLPEAAATIQKTLASRITNCPRTSQSEPIDISQHFFDEIGESAGNVPVNGFSGDLVTAASEASALLEQNTLGILNLTPNAEEELGQLEELDQSRVEAQSSHRTFMDTQGPTLLVDCAMSPIETQQFCEAVINPPAKPRFQDMLNDKFQNHADRQEADSSPGNSSVAPSYRCFQASGHTQLLAKASTEGPHVIPEEHHESSTSHESTCVDHSSGKHPIEPGSRLDKSVEAETPRQVLSLGPRRRSPRLAREARIQSTPPSMSIPVTPRSRINIRERYRAAINEASLNSLTKPSRKAKASRNKGKKPFPINYRKKTLKDAKPLPSPVSRPRRAAALSADKKIQDIIESESSEHGEFESSTGEATVPVRRDHKNDRYQSPSNSSGANEDTRRESTSVNDKRMKSLGDKKISRAINNTKATLRGLGNEKPGSSGGRSTSSDQADLVSLSGSSKPRLMPLVAPIQDLDRIDKAHGMMLTKTSEPSKEQDFIHRNSILNSTVEVSDSFFEETTAISNQDITNISRKPKKMEIPETPARGSKHANAKDPDLRGISTSLSIAAKLQSALSSVIGIRPMANTRESHNVEAFKLSVTIAPQSSKKAPDNKLPEPKNGDRFEINANTDCEKLPRPLEFRPDPSNRTRLQILSISDKTYHGNQALKNADCNSFEASRTPDDQNESHSAKRHLKTPLDVDRKCKIISFDSKGPRNQGIPSSQKPRRGLVPRCRSPELSTSVKVTGLKRKGQGDNDSEVNLVSHVGSPAKRARKNIDVARTRDSASRRGLKCESSIKHTEHKASSQSTRVDANGSPLPFIHSCKINLARPAIQPNSIPDGHNCILHVDNLQKSDCGFLSPQARLSAQNFQKYDATPSTVDKYTAHKLHSRSTSIDIQSHYVLEGARPLPWADLYKDGLKSFMDMLQRSSKNSCEQDISALATTMNQDPEKTLVKATAKQEQISSSIYSRESSSLRSSSPSSYSGDDSPSDDPSSSERGDDAGDELAAEFQPHQVKTLDVLCNISIVS